MIEIVLLAFVILVLGLTITAFVVKQGVLFMGSAAAWMILGAFSFYQSASETDVYFFLFLLCAGMVMVCAIAVWMSRSKDEVEDEEDEDIKAQRTSMEETRKSTGQYDFIYEGKGKKPRPRSSRFKDTGEF